MNDIHAHLHFAAYDADRDAVMTRAREAGVEHMLLVGTDLASSQAAVALAEQHACVSASVGIHPHEYTDASVTEENLKRQEHALRELAVHPKVVAIGECGLDYFVRQGAENKQRTVISEHEKTLQRDGFLAQYTLADEYDLPLIVHTRPSIGTMDAYREMVAMLTDVQRDRQHTNIILHCYQGDTSVTEAFLALPNVFFSFTGSITYPVKKPLIGTKDDPSEVIQRIPLERMFTETDCPYLAPQSKRGMRNEPAFLGETLEKIAEITQQSFSQVEAVLHHNFERVFALQRTKGVD